MIKKIQRFSWEPELLISGGLLFTLFQAPDYFLLLNEIITPYHFLGTHIAFALLAFSISTLTVGFTTHLVLKGFWIAWISAKYSFSNSINFERLGFSNFFTKKIKKIPTIDDQIEYLGKSAGLVFSLSFWLLLVTTGLVFLFTLLALMIGYLDLAKGFLFIILIPSFILLIDFISFGILKKNEKISKIYYPIYKVLSFMSLSQLYRSYYYTLISNVGRWKIVGYAVFFFSVSILMSYRNIIKAMNFNIPYSHNHNFYNNELPHFYYHLYLDQIPANERVRIAAIQSYNISGDYLELTVKYRNRLDGELARILIKQEGLANNDQLGILSSYFQLEIDTIKIESKNWKFSKLPQSNFLGLVNIIPVHELEKGEHVLLVRRNSEVYFKIPFWKE